jgi:hypothetical protein
MTKRNLYIAGGVAAFLALAVGYWFTAHLWTAMRVKAEAKRLIIASLPERASAEFRNVKVTLTDNVCGEISLTNDHGGYTGFQPFYWRRIGGVELKPEVNHGSDGERLDKMDLEFWQADYDTCMANGY